MKWLVRVRTEDVNGRQPAEIVCYILLKNVVFTTNAKILAEFPHKKWIFGLS